MGWRSVKKELPELGEYVDLWITGSRSWVQFYDPLRKGKTSGRTCNWYRLDGRWHCSEGLLPSLCPEVTVTHWMKRPAPPISERSAGE